MTRKTLAAFATFALAIGLSPVTADAIRSKRTCRTLCATDITTCRQALLACNALPPSDTLARSLEVACEREIIRRCKAVKGRGSKQCSSPSGAFLDPELE
jgi:hypothetical protein